MWFRRPTGAFARTLHRFRVTGDCEYGHWGRVDLQPRLLRDALPFPPPLGNAYRDHWIAQVALAAEILPMSPNPSTTMSSTATLRSAVVADDQGLISSSRMRVSRFAERVRGHGLHPGWRPFYFNIYCRTIVTSRTLQMRLGSRMSPRISGARAAKPSSLTNFRWLVGRSARNGVAGVTETLGREGAMLRGLAWRGLGEARERLRHIRPNAAATEDMYRAIPRSDQVGLKPIILDYFTRDGSTLMMRLLASSPQIAVEEVYPFERRYFAYFWCWAHVLTRDEWNEHIWDPTALASARGSACSSRAPSGLRPWPRTLPARPRLRGSVLRRAPAFDLVGGESFPRGCAVVAAEQGVESPHLHSRKAHEHLAHAVEQLPPHRVEIVTFATPATAGFRSTPSSAGERMGGEYRKEYRRMLEHVISGRRERLEWILPACWMTETSP